MPIIGITDCEDLHAALNSAAAPNPTNRGLALYLAALRELRETQRVQAYCWCDTRDMLANSLTKIEVSGRVPIEEIKDFLKDFKLRFKHPYRWGHTLTYE